jgi:hypothetical protein
VSGRWLLLRRLDALWAVPSAAVREVHRGDDGTIVTLGSSSSLQADEVLSMTPELVLRGVPSCLALQPLAGLAVWQGEPVLCIDPTAALPPALRRRAATDTTEERDARDP